MFENCCILIEIQMRFNLNGLIDKIPGLAQIMAWRQTGNKSLTGLVMALFIDLYVSLSCNEFNT